MKALPLDAEVEEHFRVIVHPSAVVAQRTLNLVLVLDDHAEVLLYLSVEWKCFHVPCSADPRRQVR